MRNLLQSELGHTGRIVIHVDQVIDLQVDQELGRTRTKRKSIYKCAKDKDSDQYVHL